MVNRTTAKKIAKNLLHQLQVGTITRIGIEEIASACDAEGPNLSQDDRECLINLTTRSVVEGVK